jgi:N-acetylneuraminic acid mutarotase
MQKVPLRLGLGVLGLGVLALAACGSDETTGPPSTPTVAGAELAVAHNTWLTRRDMPFERWDLAVADVPNAAGQSVLYAIGGRTATNSALGRVQAYNVATNTWTWKASLPTPLSATNGAGVANGKIYVSGGLFTVNGWGYQGAGSRTYMYDPTKNVWTEKARTPAMGAWGVTGAIGGKLYVLTTCIEEPFEGAFYYDVCDPSKFFRYNPATNLWATLPRPHGTYTMGSVLGEKLFVTDGQMVEVYDPATNKWTAKTSGGERRIDGAATAQGALLYLFGGRQFTSALGWQPVRTVKVYHPTTNTWTTAAPLPSARYDIAAARVFLDGRPRIEVLGGSLPGNNLQYIP